MAVTFREATKVQIGKEAAHGTVVAATRRLTADTFTFTDEVTQEMFEGEMGAGLLSRAHRRPQPTMRHSMMQMDWRMDFQQILLPLLAGFKGGVAPTTPPQATDARLWTFDADPASAGVLETYTWEFAESDLATDYTHRFPYSYCSALNITMPPDAVPTAQATFQGRAAEDSVVLTPGLAIPELTTESGSLATVYMDDAWANLGGTQELGSVFNIEFAAEFGWQHDFYNDDREDYDFSIVNPKMRMATLGLDVAVHPEMASFAREEERHKKNQDRRFGRVQWNGDTIDSGVVVLGPDQNVFMGADQAAAEAARDAYAAANAAWLAQYDADDTLLIRLDYGAQSTYQNRVANAWANVANPATIDYDEFLRIDGSWVHMDDSLAERGNDREGNLMVRINLTSIYDPVSDKDFEFAVQNSLTAFP